MKKAFLALARTLAAGTLLILFLETSKWVSECAASHKRGSFFNRLCETSREIRCTGQVVWLYPPA